MSYSAASISAAGLTIPAYQDILDYLISSYQGIFGSTLYLGPETPDYQMLSLFSLIAADNNKTLQLVLNNFNPGSAVGVALDSVIKMNGLTRRSAVNSTCTVTLVVSVLPLTITNGQVLDTNGNLWALPSPLTVSGTSTNVTATCTQSGPITANAGTLTLIATPVAGWTSVTNPVPAVAGSAAEKDSALRARQAISVAQPSSTRLSGTITDVGDVEGVTRYLILENNTGGVDSYGNPAHSITAVVEGGTDVNIATAIYDNKGIGPTVNGTNPAAGATLVSYVVTDANNGGLSQTINFFRPQYIAITVNITIHQLTGYTSATTAAIQTAVAAYVNNLQIGQSILFSELYYPILSVQNSQSTPQFSVRGLNFVASATTYTGDLTLLFYQVASCASANVNISFV